MARARSVARVGIALLGLGAGVGACDRAQQGEPAEEAAQVAAPPAPIGAVEASDAASEASDPGLDAVAEAVEIDTVTPGVIWLGTDTMREVLFALAADAWRLEPAEGGVALRVGSASRLATRLGLRDGDVVTALNDTPVRGRADARAAMVAFSSGERVHVVLRRDGAQRRILARVVDGGSPSAWRRVEDIVAAGLHEAPEPAIERAVLVGIGRAEARLAHRADRVLELFGLPPDAADISLDDASITREDLARALGSAASGDRLELVAGGTTVSRRIVSGAVDASDLEHAIERRPITARPRPPRRAEAPGGGEEAPAEPIEGEPTTEAEPSIEGLERVDEQHVRITRDLVDTWMSDPSKLAKQARIVPSHKDGVTQGYKLYGIRRRGSIAMALGFENGDMITAIDGHAITDLTTVIEVVAGLRKAKKVEIKFQRGGASMLLEIDIVTTL